MAALITVQDYVEQARKLLQDEVSPYRYPDEDIVSYLNLAFMEAKLLRPDLFIRGATTPNFNAVSATPVQWDEMYRVPLLYYIVGMCQLRDDEEVQDQRAAAFIAMFKSQLRGGV